MAATPQDIAESPNAGLPTPAPPGLVAQATGLVKAYPECFWFWHPTAEVRYLEDVRLVVQHLRQYGDQRAWRDAQKLHRCLSPLFKKKS